MAYSHQRLRKTLAVARIGAGLLLVVAAWHKLFSPEYAQAEWQRSVSDFLNGQAVSFYPHGALDVVWRHLFGFATATGILEMALGVSLLLGLAVRLSALLGIFYYLNFLLVSWNQADAFGDCLALQSERLFLMLLLLLFCLGHAGETWGLGSLYHGQRARRWEEEQRRDGAHPAEGNAAALNEEDDELDPRHAMRIVQKRS